MKTKYIKGITLTKKQIYTILGMIAQEFHYENSSAHEKHLLRLENTLIKKLKV